MILGIDSRLSFGRYKGKTLKEIASKDPGYLIWASQTIDGFDLSAKAESAILKGLEDKARKIKEKQKNWQRNIEALGRARSRERSAA